MIIDEVLSVNKKSIRLTEERWRHIIENHNEIASLRQEVLETIYLPDFIAEGTFSELYACKFYKDLRNYL